MNFLKKLFARKPEDYLIKGDNLLTANSPFEARSAYEDGLESCQGKPDLAELAEQFTSKISQANTALALLNIEEAEHAIARSAHDKAAEHLELAITLTTDRSVREKAESILSGLTEKTNDTVVLATSHNCGTCSQPSASETVISSHSESELSLQEYYDLLILQLPEEIQSIYATLGEDFASAYIAASHDNHQEALTLLEKWFKGSHRDIYCYEKGQILHRLGKIKESESQFRAAIKENEANPLPHLGLALLLIEEHRFPEAAGQLDRMIENDIFAGQALLMRGEVYHLAGHSDAAIEQFAALLDTPLGHAAGEKLYALLLECGRKTEADHIFKKYLSKKCKH